MMLAPKENPLNDPDVLSKPTPERQSLTKQDPLNDPLNDRDVGFPCAKRTKT